MFRILAVYIGRAASIYQMCRIYISNVTDIQMIKEIG